MKNYKIDFVANTLTITKAFEDAASIPGTEEYELFQKIRADFPGIQIVRKTRRPSKSAPKYKNLTYANMEKYMSVFQNATELLAQFEIVKAQSYGQTNRYNFVKDWFVAQFPKYKELPDFSENAPKVLDFETFKKKQEEKMKKEAEEQAKKGA